MRPASPGFSLPPLTGSAAWATCVSHWATTWQGVPFGGQSLEQSSFRVTQPGPTTQTIIAARQAPALPVHLCDIPEPPCLCKVARRAAAVLDQDRRGAAGYFPIHFGFVVAGRTTGAVLGASAAGPLVVWTTGATAASGNSDGSDVSLRAPGP